LVDGPEHARNIPSLRVLALMRENAALRAARHAWRQDDQVLGRVALAPAVTAQTPLDHLHAKTLSMPPWVV